VRDGATRFGGGMCRSDERKKNRCGEYNERLLD